jgi:hypothetical protein
MADDVHPARKAGLLSQKYVSEKNREAWLDLFADDAIVQDPVGISPLDPTGKGQIGKAGIAAFWDDVISKGDVSFDYPRSYAAGDECAFIGTVYSRLGGHEFGPEGVFVYRVDEHGRILSLRAFWEFERPQPGGDIHPPVGRERKA